MLSALTERLLSTDTPQESKALLRAIARWAPPSPVLTQHVRVSFKLQETYETFHSSSLTVSCQFVDLLSCFEDTEFVIHLTPEILREASPAEIKSVFEAYEQLFHSNRTFIVPIIGALSEIPLPDSLKVLPIIGLRNSTVAYSFV